MLGDGVEPRFQGQGRRGDWHALKWLPSWPSQKTRSRRTTHTERVQCHFLLWMSWYTSSVHSKICLPWSLTGWVSNIPPLKECNSWCHLWENQFRGKKINSIKNNTYNLEKLIAYKIGYIAGWLLENRVQEAVSSFWLCPLIMRLQGTLNSKTFKIKNLNLSGLCLF